MTYETLCMASKECIVVLHGYGKSSSSMQTIASSLEKNGYNVINVNYPSRKYNIQTIAEKYVKPQIVGCINARIKVHFVGYSMGGIISRFIIENNKIRNLGNVVLIAAPNKGSSISSIIKKNAFLARLFGPAVTDLAVDSLCVKSLHKHPNYPIGIITANSSHNPITSLFFLSGHDDGIVTAKSTIIDNAVDTTVINATHISIIYLEETSQQVLNFLKYQRFIKKKQI